MTQLARKAFTAHDLLTEIKQSAETAEAMSLAPLVPELAALLVEIMGYRTAIENEAQLSVQLRALCGSSALPDRELGLSFCPS